MSAVLDFALPADVRAEILTAPDDATSRLRQLLGRIVSEHALVTTHLHAAVDHARRAGLLLMEAKQALPHGSWGPWLEQAGVPDRTAQLYMAIASRWAEIETHAGDPQRVADLTIRECQRIIGSLSERRAKTRAYDRRQLRLFDDCNPTPRNDKPVKHKLNLYIPIEDIDAFCAMVSRLGVAAGTSTITATIVPMILRAHEELVLRRTR